jgi:hypothetical protein
MSLTYDGNCDWVMLPPPSGLDTFVNAPIYVTGRSTAATSYLGADGIWHVTSTRAAKTNIKDLSTLDAWAQLDRLTPVEFEYRKSKTLIRAKDGREISYDDAVIEAQRMARSHLQEGQKMSQELVSESLAEITSGDAYNVWTDEPSGLKTQGFIAEDLPDNIAAADHKSYAPALVTVANTAALKEAKRRIEAQEKEIETLNARLAKLEGTGTKDLTGTVAVASATLTQAEWSRPWPTGRWLNWGC